MFLELFINPDSLFQYIGMVAEHSSSAYGKIFNLAFFTKYYTVLL